MVKAGIAIDICERDDGILPELNGGISMKKFCVTSPNLVNLISLFASNNFSADAKRKANAAVEDP